MKEMIRGYLANVYQEHEKASQHLESQRIEYEQLEQNLDKCQAQNKTERRKLQWLKQKNLMATQEQQKAGEDMMRLAEEQQRESEELHKQVREYEQKLEAVQALELEMECMKGELQVMGQMQEGEDSYMKEKIETTEKELKMKEKDWECQEKIYQALVVKHGYTNDELHDARKALIESLPEVTVGAENIGVKWMGALDKKPFQELAKKKYPSEEANKKAKELLSLWEGHLRDSAWHPIKVVVKDGTPRKN